MSSVGLAGGERGSRKRQIGLKVRRFGDTQKLIFWQVAHDTGSRTFNILCRLFPKAKKSRRLRFALLSHEKSAGAATVREEMVRKCGAKKNLYYLWHSTK